MRAGVAMVALSTSCKGVFLKLFRECRSGELVGVRILRDKERKAITIKETVTYSKKRTTGRTKREIAKWSQGCENGELGDSGSCSRRVPS